MERQNLLEESLLSLAEFEDAYSELWAWLTDALRQLGEAEPITGDPDVVAAQLAKHKVEVDFILSEICAFLREKLKIWLVIIGKATGIFTLTVFRYHFLMNGFVHLFEL